MATETEIEAVAGALMPWLCGEGHLVPGWAMPQSGTRCNVHGCTSPERFVSSDPGHWLDAESEAQKAIAALDRVRAEDTRDVAEMEFVAQRIEAGAETGGDYGRAFLNAARMVREALAGFSGGASAGGRTPPNDKDGEA